MIKRLVKLIIELCLRFVPVQTKLALFRLILLSIGEPQSQEFHSGDYGQLPKKVLNFEKFYDDKTGGWYQPQEWTSISYDFRDYGSVELEVGRLWYAFVRLTKPKMVLETGTYKGYSTCCIATALRDIGENGHVYTIDPYNIEHLWNNTSLEPFITWIPKYSQHSLSLVENKEFDLLILDSDHSYKTVMWELIHFEKLLNVGGHILMHDSLYFDGVGAAVKQLYQNDKFEVITLTSPRNHGNLGSRCPGVTIARKKAQNPAGLKYEETFDTWEIGEVETIPYLFRNLDEH